MNKLISLITVFVLCISLVACGGSPAAEPPVTLNPTEQAKAKLVEAYNTCCEGSDKEYAVLTADNMSLTLDSKPYDSYYSGQNDAFAAMQSINSYLGFSTSLWEKMSATRALDGMQTQSSRDYTVTWTYHPDKGLRVIYEVNP